MPTTRGNGARGAPRMPVICSWGAGLLLTAGLSGCLGGANPVAEERAPEIGLSEEQQEYEVVMVWGEEGSEPGQLLNPRHLAVTRDFQLLVTDTGNNRVQIFTTNGRFIRAFGERGVEPGQFLYFEGIAIGENSEIWTLDRDVSDGDPTRVQHFTIEGESLGSWGEPGDEVSQLRLPQSICWHARALYLTDSPYIKRFSEEGEFLGTWTAEGRDPWHYPRDIDFDRMWDPSYAVVKDWELYRIDQRQVVLWQTHEYFWYIGAVAIGPEHNVFYQHQDLSPGTPAVYKIGKSGGVVAEFGGTGEEPGQFVLPTGIAVDDSGYVYVADWTLNRITKFRRADPTAVQATSWSGLKRGDG